MAMDDLARVYEHVLSDPARRKRIASLPSEEVPAALLDMADALGVELTRKDLRRAVERADSSLGLPELDGIVGGLSLGGSFIGGGGDYLGLLGKGLGSYGYHLPNSAR